VTACSEQESAQTYISKAESLIVKEQNSEAIISLKNALKVDAKNAKARYILGKLYLNLGFSDQAIKELERALKYKFNPDKVIPLLARAYMLAEDDESILSLATQEELLTSTSTRYFAYKTMAALRTGDKALAEQTVKAAFSVSQNDSYSMLASAYFEFSNQNIEHANTLVERILVATPNNVDAIMLQGQIALTDKRYSLAVDSFKKYLKMQPNSGRVLLFIADALIKDGQHNEAEKIADSILVKVPAQPFMQYIKAMARFEDKDYEAASSYANQSINSGFNSFTLKLVAGASAFYLENHEQSNQHLKDIMLYISPTHPARKMLAISQLKLGLIDDISETMTGYESSSKENSQFLSTLSYELLEIGAFEKAQEMANYAASSSDVSAEQEARSGVLKLMMNDPSGIDNLEVALQQNPELISAELALAFASIKSGDLSRARAISNKWLKQYPDKAAGDNLQATIFLKENKFEEGKAAFEKSLQLEPNNVYALTQLVKVAIIQKETEEALLLAEQALKAHPNNVEILRQYFELHQNESGLKILTQAQQSNTGNIQYGVLLAEALIGLKQYKKAVSLLDSYSLDVKTPKRYWQISLAANARLTESKDVVSIFEKWHKTNPYHIEPVFLLANYWTINKLPDKALNILKKASKQHPNNLMIHLVKMQVLLINKRSSDAKILLKEIKKFDINKGLLAGIEGRILLLDKDFSAAVPKLEQQYKAKSNSNNAMYLAIALEGNNQKPEAIKLLEQYSEKEEVRNKIIPRISLNLANMYLAKHPGKAIVQYERLITVTPKNVVALNNLSWLYMEQGKLDKALQYSEQAYNLTDKIPNVVDTYAQALLKSGNKVEALTKARQAYKLSDGKSTDIALNLVETLLANNKRQEAKIILGDINAVTDEHKERKKKLMK
jgi:putative PEP-CTERM system TPR-repeat lipoprotein